MQQVGRACEVLLWPSEQAGPALQLLLVLLLVSCLMGGRVSCLRHSCSQAAVHAVGS